MIRLDHFVQTDLALSMCDAYASGGGRILAVCHLGELERQNANRGGTRTVAKRAFIFMYLGLNKKAFILHHTFVLRVRILVSPERIEWHVCSYIFGLIGQLIRSSGPHFTQSTSVDEAPRKSNVAALTDADCDFTQHLSIIRLSSGQKACACPHTLTKES